MRRFLRDHFLFRPWREVDGSPAELSLVYEDVSLVTADGLRLHAWWIPAEGARVAFLWFHGNAGNIGHRLGEAEQLNRLGVSLLLLDYRGYGRSEGRPSEEGFRLDADAALAWLEARGTPRDSIVVYGRSLGAAVATDLAARESGFAGLVVATPFTSLRDVAPHALRIPFVGWLAGRGFEVEETIPRVSCPVLVVAGAADTLTPPDMARRLAAAATARCELHVVPEGGHESTHVEGEPAGFGHALAAFLNGLSS